MYPAATEIGKNVHLFVGKRSLSTFGNFALKSIERNEEMKSKEFSLIM